MAVRPPRRRGPEFLLVKGVLMFLIDKIPYLFGEMRMS